MQDEYSADLDAINIFLKNSDLLAKRPSFLKERIHLLTSSKHKEITLRNCKKHKHVIKRLFTELADVRWLADDLKWDKIGEKNLQDFISKRMEVDENDAVSFFLRQLQTRN